MAIWGCQLNLLVSRLKVVKSRKAVGRPSLPRRWIVESSMPSWLVRAMRTGGNLLEAGQVRVNAMGTGECDSPRKGARVL
jgi:hypothetical protein